MKELNLKFCMVVVILFTFCITPCVKADWKPDDGHKMHFPQLPDEDGWNVNATAPLILADDWRCSETGWVKDIHFWGSWKHGKEGQIQTFVLSIHDNIPAGPDVPYSRPGKTLWEREIEYFHAVPIDPPTVQGWYDPNSGETIWDDHSNYFQYNIILQETDWFWQEEGKIYWLNISAIVQDPFDTQWGWKSTEDHWMDDAVWALWGQLDWKDIFEPEPTDVDFFEIMIDPAGGFAGGGGSGYVSSDPTPPSVPPWYYYENTEWWNQWYYDGEFDANRYKVVHIEFFAYQPWQDFPSELTVALNWSTPEWPPQPQPEPVPPLPLLTPDEESKYIGRQVLMTTDRPDGHYTLDYVIRDYNPEWVSIDVQGYNFDIPDGIIVHSCVQSLDLAFVITGDKLDFGDAPDPTYPTFLAKNGARHIIAGPWMGDLTDAPDSEPDGQPFPAGMGDDMDGNDDEDGLTLPTLTPGQAVSFKLEVNNAPAAGAAVQIWIDYNQSGNWEHPAEQAYSGLLPNGINAITINVPSSAVPGMTFARARISTAGKLTPVGQANDGEVEDTEVYIEEPQLDFGDAPQGPYPTKLDLDGARHIIVTNVLLGASIDPEPDGQPNANATGDDGDGNDDEDGVTLDPIMPGTVTNAYITPSADGFINAWLDYNGDGDWDDIAERIFTDYPVTGGVVNTCPFGVPFYAQPGIQTFARFRYTTSAGGVAPLSYTGLAQDGEVEDYMVDIEENPAIKWIQLPDTTPNGIDIKVDDTRWIADDFTCTRYGLITDVHLFGSWKYDEKGEITRIHLSFHSDDPIGEGGTDPDNKFSKPDKLLWEKDFFMGQFDEDLIRDLLDNGEYWWDPATAGELIQNGDSQIWRIDIYIPEHEAFPQEGSPEEPIIYWLDVQVETEFGEFGWKTRRYPRQHLDDAVFDIGSELPRIWKELRYPAEHPYHPNSIDMAFILTGKDLKPPLKNLKWSQPPIEIDPLLEDPYYCGWNEESWTQNPDEVIPLHSVVDDFRCIGLMPVASVHFWGSYLGWDFIEPPLMQPIAWDVKFYANVAADSSCNFLYGAATGQNTGNAPSSLYRIDPTTGNALLIGAIGFNGVTGLSVGPDGKLYASANGDDLYADGFQHAILLTIDTSSGAGTLIGEISNNSLPNGAGRMPDISFSKDGVLYGYADNGPGGDALWTINTATGAGTFIGYTGFTWGGNGLDFAPDGTLYATPADKGCLVTIDPTTGAGTCVPGTEPNVPNRINALDFCKRNGVLYGSWNDGFASGNNYLVKIDLQTGQPSVIGQTILGLDAITFGPEFSHPGNLLYQIQIPADRIHTEWAGYDEFPEMPFESCFQHHVDLNKDEYFWQDRYSERTDDNIYWLGIRAIYPAGVDIANPWGWKTRPASWMDDAVKYECRVVGWEIEPGSGDLIPVVECRYWPIEDPIWGESFDVAFELDTHPDYVKWEQPFTGIRHWPHFEDILSMAKEDTAGNINIIQKVADDWPCRRKTPISALAWFGSYLGYRYQPCQTMAAPPVPPDYFLITIHKDVSATDPCNIYPFSHPGEKIWQYRADDYDEVLVGYDKHPKDQTGPPREPVYRYSVRLPQDEWFVQEEVNGVYWISIMAVYGANVNPNHQGWGWTNHKHVYNDDAVAGTWEIGIPEPVWRWKEIYDQLGNSADMSFILFTKPYPDCWAYLTQCHGDTNNNGTVKGDDFYALKKSWYKSYSNPDYDPCADFNRNGSVKGDDFYILKTHWYQTVPPDCPIGGVWPPPTP